MHKVLEKTCRHCHETKPAGQFRRNLKLRDGLDSWCRACALESTASWRARHPEYEVAHNEARRVKLRARKCRQCGERFTPKRKDSTTCSIKCQRERYNAARRKYPR